jgi:hypothetical protein
MSAATSSDTGRASLDADYIAWTDYDRVENVAIRSGHPANNVWKVNGKAMDAVQLRALIGHARVFALSAAESHAEELRIAKRDAWDEGAKWAAIELGVVKKGIRWLEPGDNPYGDAL